ncbi:RsmB/NOP family class I SAM-dependent RNA methyltransferase [Ichthyobacterium seriolicida]|uniref:RNA methyltransferase n=1 Tax=Ichthyobacterium seriolicida TaxID=242600 RepID=A0A1J1EC27_9FLAO|nr:class I SAM-dependent methyltransferase [Ichthyobacterium seriolicida]BAV95064.1 RNA methyltransferase [Ichthyobacterium seriolicida]
MRLHRNLVLAVIDALYVIFNEGVFANKAIEKTLKKDVKWGSRDRGFIAESIYDIVRNRRLLTYVSNIKPHYDKKNIWKLFASWRVINDYRLSEWPEFETTPVRKIKSRHADASKDRRLRESIPDWLDDLCFSELGNSWDREVSSLNEMAKVVLRVNTTKTSISSLRSDLFKEGIESYEIEAYKSALVLKERKNVFSTECFKKGYFEVQDASSQLVSEFLDIKPKMNVVDACAGAGGKTLHISNIMDNKGNIIAMDIDKYKLFELKRRAKRNGAFNINIRCITSSKVVKRMDGCADRLLLDVPCSGLGVLKRNPDIKWKLTRESLDELKGKQEYILSKYSKMLKIEGKMVYATCSILPSENELQIQKFISQHDNFELIKERKISPYKTGFDGFYIAVLKRIG